MTTSKQELEPHVLILDKDECPGCAKEPNWPKCYICEKDSRKIFMINLDENTTFAVCESCVIHQVFHGILHKMKEQMKEEEEEEKKKLQEGAEGGEGRGGGEEEEEGGGEETTFASLATPREEGKH